MPDSLREFFSSAFFMPHGHCYLWKPALVWLQVLANGSIALAYVAIFATLVYLVRRIRDIPFQWMYVCFAVFILTCGFTHLFDVYVIWNPAYWLDGSVRAITAVASIGTAVLLPPLVPKAIALAEAAALSHERGIRLADANRELGILLDRTNELEQLKTQFFANMSHELRTPLTLILGPAEKLLASANLSAEQRRDLELIGRNGRTLLKHVNDLLDVSKLEAQKMTLDYATTDVARLVRLVASNFDAIAAERGLTYRVDAPTTLIADIDSEKIERVLLNLLSNAFKFSPGGGVIRCQLDGDTAQGTFRILVADSGIGIKPEHRDLIFERFRQADAGTTRRFGGTGLGLAIAKDFVTLHRGSISVGAAPEGGALFTVELPAKAPAGAALSSRPLEPTPRPPADSVARQVLEELRAHVAPPDVTSSDDRALVLVVEDNAEMNRFITETIGGEHRTAVAFDGAEGLRKARELEPDLVVCDVMMPSMSGDQLVSEIRRQPALDRVPILVLTAKADDDLRVRLLQQGAHDYVMKPFSGDELRARVLNLVKMKRARDLLQRELAHQGEDLEALAREVTARHRELATALQAMRVARDQAERASQVKTTFLGLVSHELRTPITALGLQMERLRRELAAEVSPRQRDLLERMAAAVGRLTSLIESLLEHAQIESGRLSLTVQTFDPRVLAQDTIEELRLRAEQKNLALQLMVPDDLPQLESDPRLVRLILVNLVENAIKYTQQGRIEVSMSTDPATRTYRIAVSDTGPGIPADMHGRVFEPFVQLEDIRKKHLPGVGLGLPLVKEMTEALGGRVQLDSTVGAGTTFTVHIPLQLAADRRATATIPREV